MLRGHKDEPLPHFRGAEGKLFHSSKSSKSFRRRSSSMSSIAAATVTGMARRPRVTLVGLAVCAGLIAAWALGLLAPVLPGTGGDAPSGLSEPTTPRIGQEAGAGGGVYDRDLPRKQEEERRANYERLQQERRRAADERRNDYARVKEEAAARRLELEQLEEERKRLAVETLRQKQNEQALENGGGALEDLANERLAMAGEHAELFKQTAQASDKAASDPKASARQQQRGTQRDPNDPPDPTIYGRVAKVAFEDHGAEPVAHSDLDVDETLCRELKQAHACTDPNDVLFMGAFCPKTCDSTHPSLGHCRDFNARQCVSWMRHGECKRASLYMSVNCPNTCHTWLTQPEQSANLPGYAAAWARTHGCPVAEQLKGNALDMMNMLNARHHDRIGVLRAAHANDAPASEHDTEVLVGLEDTERLQDILEGEDHRVVFVFSPVHKNLAPTQHEIGPVDDPKYVNVYYESTHEMNAFHFRARSPDGQLQGRDSPVMGGHGGAAEVAGFAVSANKRTGYVSAMGTGASAIPANDAPRPRFLTQLRIRGDYPHQRICPNDLNVFVRDSDDNSLHAVEHVAFDDATVQACANIHGAAA